MIRGRASESRNAVARLIGKGRSVGSSGAGFSLRPRSLPAGEGAGTGGVEGDDGGRLCSDRLAAGTRVEAATGGNWRGRAEDGAGLAKSGGGTGVWPRQGVEPNQGAAGSRG